MDHEGFCPPFLNPGRQTPDSCGFQTQLNPIPDLLSNNDNQGEMTMLKKVIAGMIVTGLSIALIAGAVNRTANKSDQGASTAALNGRNQGQAVSRNSAGIQEGSSRNSDSAKTDGASGLENGGRYGNRGGNGSNANPADPERLNDGLALVEDTYSIEGTVFYVDDASLVLLMSQGEEYVIEGRSWTYALQSGFATAADHTVKLVGFNEGGEFKIISMRDLDTLAAVTLREETGRPLWAGRGGRNA
jgi:hypothetical protein